MTPLERTELLRIYAKTNGGHTQLSDEDFVAYSALRKKEYQDHRDELLALGATNIRAVKDDAGDIVGWMWSPSAV